MVYPESLRWLVVWKAWFMGMSYAKVRRHLDGGASSPPPSKQTIRRIVNRFRRVGDVKTELGKRRAPHDEQIEFSRSLSKALIECVLDSPDDPLEAIAKTFGAQTGVQRSNATICRALRKLGFTRKKLRAFSRRRNEAAAQAFLTDILRHHSPSDLLFVDETSKDGRALRGSFGYAALGESPIAENGLYPRGKRVSSLCSFDLTGFVDWVHTDGTYNRQRFRVAARHAVVRHVRPGTVVILDNARIHKDPGFVREVNAAGGIVRFLPPYCFDLTPLDNGAFGMVKRYLQKHAWLVEKGGIEHALDRAFRKMRGGKIGRYCFRNCGYI